MSKLEKADILEMTVNFLRSAPWQHRDNQTSSNSYKAGFNECATEVMKCLSDETGISPQLKCRLGDHLSRSARVLHARNGSSPGISTSNSFSEQLAVDIPDKVANSSYIQPHGDLLLRLPLHSQMEYSSSPSVFGNFAPTIESGVQQIGNIKTESHCSVEQPWNAYGFSTRTPFDTNQLGDISGTETNVRRCLYVTPSNVSSSNDSLQIKHEVISPRQEQQRNDQLRVLEDRLNNNEQEDVWRPW